MKLSYLTVLPTLLAGSALANSLAIANSKLAQYPTLEDCQNRRNLIHQRKPLEGQCYTKDFRTRALFLVRGTCCAGAHFVASPDDKCRVAREGLKMGECITVPSGTQSISFGIGSPEPAPEAEIVTE